jgi:hypothetical protein
MHKLIRTWYARTPLMLLMLSILAVFLAGCGGSSSGESGSPQTGIQGQLLETTEGPLPESVPTTIAFAGGKVTVLSADGAQTVTTVTSDAGGNFQVNLPIGSYQVEASGFDASTPQAVTVSSAGYAKIMVVGYRYLP